MLAMRSYTNKIISDGISPLSFNIGQEKNTNIRDGNNSNNCKINYLRRHSSSIPQYKAKENTNIFTEKSNNCKTK